VATAAVVAERTVQDGDKDWGGNNDDNDDDGQRVRLLMGVLTLTVARVHACPEVDRGRTDTDQEQREEKW